ncbi:MAG: OFA family MFS transporter [Candidatus Wallbacteria bacterium]
MDGQNNSSDLRGNLRLFGMKAVNGRWVFVVIGILINLCLGSVYSWSIFKGPLEKLYGINATQSSLPYMIFLAMQSIGMLLMGKSLDKYNPARMIFINGVFIGIGLYLAGLSRNITELTICFSFIFGFPSSIIYGTPISVVTKWFPDKKGLAIGLTLMGIGLSPLFLAPVSVKIISNYGVLNAFKASGALFFAVICMVSMFIKFPPEGWIESFKNSGNGIVSDKLNNSNEPNAVFKTENYEYSHEEIFKIPAFYVLWVCYTMAAIVGLMMIGITGQVASEIGGVSPVSIAVFISIFGMFNGCGRPIFGWIVDSYSPKVAMYINFIGILSWSLIMIACSSIAEKGMMTIMLYSIAFCGFWMCHGGWLAIAPAAVAKFFGVKNSSQNYSIIFTGFGVAAITGSLLAGRLKDILGSYNYVFYITLAIAVSGIIIVRLFIDNKQIESKK